MTAYDVIFYFFEAAAAISALALILSRNVFYGALYLIVCLLSVAGIYVLCFAEFLAATQILVYAGGVLVLIIFGIMITSRIGNLPLRVEHKNVFSGSVVALAFFIVLCYYFALMPAKATMLPETGGTLETIGMNLFTSHVIQFEIAGILLLIALIGAAVIASEKKSSHDAAD